MEYRGWQELEELVGKKTIGTAREMANGVEHSVLGSGFNRIFDVELVNRSMQFATLLDNCRKIFV